ncbi:MAG: DUF664 domain-containing protein [Dehalococcoidia bacterium]|nr:DUF664 domain-containing protein [Dehalococcoidia bacterium]
MNADVETYSRYIRKQIAGIRDCLAGLSEEQVNHVPHVHGANSMYVIGTHVLGNARAWVLGIVCGQALRRDRPAEFASGGTEAGFAAAAGALSREIEGALARYDGSDLDRPFKPAQELWGEGEVQEITKRIALADVLEHASIHLGHVQLTRDLLPAEGAR